VDTGYFNAGFDKLEKDEFDVAWMRRQLRAHAPPDEIYHARWLDVWQEIHTGKIKWPRLLSLDGWSQRIGLNALMNDTGFRDDGSYRYPDIDLDITDPRHRDFQFSGTLASIAKGSGRFAWGDAPSEPALREMDSLLDFCAMHHIDVIGFTPPHAHAVWAAMLAAGQKYAYIEKLIPELHSRFAAHGFEFYNYSDLAMFGAADTETVDGFHGSERAYLRLLVAMLEEGSRLNAVADLPKLQAVLTASQGHRYE
jgi:hypothetical protein